jgi:hypothetical protein
MKPAPRGHVIGNQFNDFRFNSGALNIGSVTAGRIGQCQLATFSKTSPRRTERAKGDFQGRPFVYRSVWTADLSVHELHHCRF